MLGASAELWCLKWSSWSSGRCSLCYSLPRFFFLNQKVKVENGEWVCMKWDFLQLTVGIKRFSFLYQLSQPLYCVTEAQTHAEETLTNRIHLDTGTCWDISGVITMPPNTYSFTLIPLSLGSASTEAFGSSMSVQFYHLHRLWNIGTQVSSAWLLVVLVIVIEDPFRGGRSCGSPPPQWTFLVPLGNLHVNDGAESDGHWESLEAHTGVDAGEKGRLCWALGGGWRCPSHPLC